MAKEWKTFFNGHAYRYMDEPFTTGTEGEVRFLAQELGLNPGDRVLDVGCGTGRHAIEVAKRGCRVTGVDLSDGMLREAAAAAAAAGVEVAWVQGDVAESLPEDSFDAAWGVCEGAFCLLGRGEDPVDRDRAVFRNVRAALKEGGRFLLTALNAMRRVRATTEEEIERGGFDTVGMCEQYEMPTETPDGPGAVTIRERFYTPTELVLLARVSGFEVDAVWSGTAGNWTRRPPQLDEMEIMIVATAR